MKDKDYRHLYEEAVNRHEVEEGALEQRIAELEEALQTIAATTKPDKVWPPEESHYEEVLSWADTPEDAYYTGYDLGYLHGLSKLAAVAAEALAKLREES